MKKIFILLFIILFSIISLSLFETPAQPATPEVVTPPVQIQYVQPMYLQIGFLTPVSNEKNQILPLMGRRLNRDYWNYYTISNQHNNIRLPITFKGKNTMADYGVQELDHLDIVLVEGYNTNFKVNIYSH